MIARLRAAISRNFTRRSIITHGYKAWEYRWRRFELRITRYTIGEPDSFALGIHVVLKGQP